MNGSYRKLEPKSLSDLYWNKKLSTVEIAELYGISNQAVNEFMQRYNIPRRTLSEASLNRREKRMAKKVIDEEVMELIDGLLLGDASITSNRLSINLRASNLDFIQSLKDFFKKKKIVSNIYPVNKKKEMGINREKQYELSTECLLLFERERERWYPNQKKRIPDDIRISPFSLAIWYMGDGSLIQDKRNGALYYIRLATEGFSRSNVFHFKRILEGKYGWHLCIDARNHLLLSRMLDIYDFLKQTEQYKIPSFSYKWRALDNGKGWRKLENKNFLMIEAGYMTNI